MSWMNNDGLYIKFGQEEGRSAVGGEFAKRDTVHEYEVLVDYTEALSATNAILDGGSTASTTGPFGVVLPKGLRLEEVETVVKTAFTSSGTIAASTIQLGTKLSSDRSTDVAVGSIIAATATGAVLGLATVGTKTILRVGSTGAGTLLGTTLANNQVLAIANTLHGTNPFTAGQLLIKIRGTYP